MRAAVALVTLAGLAACADETTPPWQLDADRVVAVRMEPPHLPAGGIARMRGLVARAGEPVLDTEPLQAGAPFAPAGLFTVVHFNIDHWEIDAPDEARLAEARAELGLAADAPIPIDVTLTFPGALIAQKTIWLGGEHANPALPVVTVAGRESGEEIVVETGREVVLAAEVATTDRVRWLTSCGELEDDDRPTATLDVDRPCTGELVLVLRDELGGVAWRVWPVRTL